jgi:hypothetical protein
MADVDFRFEEMDLAKHPFILIMPCVASPGILWNENPTNKFTILGFSTHISPSPTFPVRTKRTIG